MNEPSEYEQNKSRGFYGRYKITKADGTPAAPEAEYFVLRLDDFGGDPTHVAACRLAVLAYAEAVKDHLPILARELIARYAPKVYLTRANLTPEQIDASWNLVLSHELRYVFSKFTGWSIKRIALHKEGPEYLVQLRIELEGYGPGLRADLVPLRQALINLGY